MSGLPASYDAWRLAGPPDPPPSAWDSESDIAAALESQGVPMRLAEELAACLWMRTLPEALTETLRDMVDRAMGAA